MTLRLASNFLNFFMHLSTGLAGGSTKELLGSVRLHRSWDVGKTVLINNR